MYEKTLKVKDLIKLNSLEGSVLLTGDSAADTPIFNINVMEVPDIVEWVQPNEFLMTTGYMYRENLNAFIDIIPQLKAKGVAALGIKPHRFIDEIPQELIQCAQKYNFPLLKLAEKTAFSLVIREAMEKILLSDMRQEENFVYQLMNPENVSKQTLSELIQSYGISLTSQTVFHFIIPYSWDSVGEPAPDSSENNKNSHGLSMYQYRIRTEIKRQLEPYGIRIFSILRNNMLTMLAIADSSAYWKSTIASEKDFFQHLSAEHRTSFVISQGTHDLMKIGNVGEDAGNLLLLSKNSHRKDAIILWQAMGIEATIPYLQKTPFHKYLLERYIQPLLEYDAQHNSNLFETLSVLLQNNNNMKEAAKQLFIHYNTICYRMKLIYQLVDFDEGSLEQLTEIYLAMLLYSHN